MKKMMLIFGILFMFMSCEESPEVETKLIALEISAPLNPIRISAGQTVQLEARAVYLTTSTRTIINDGALQSVVYYDADSTSETVSLSRYEVSWFSSNPGVARITDGLLIGESAGNATVWISKDDITSKRVNVAVN